MKKIIAVLLLTLCYSLNFAQAKAEIDKKTFKFPKTKEGITINHTYNLTNTGDAPLLIQKYEVSCSCTILKFPKDPILPNQSVKLEVTFDTKDKIGWQDRIISLYSNAENSPNKLRFKVMVDNK
tara:strand:- start:120 stop:491 length:372 start_codon:yes stop_codon:yes gene_type:complete